MYRFLRSSFLLKSLDCNFFTLLILATVREKKTMLATVTRAKGNAVEMPEGGKDVKNVIASLDVTLDSYSIYVGGYTLCQREIKTDGE